MTNECCRVLRHEDIGAGYRIIDFNAPQIAAAAIPGQFVHVKVPGLEESALRRPFSIFNAEGEVLSVMYKTVGRGTSALSRVVVGDEVEVMGALGHGFPVKCEGTALLVGGGFGVAPLYFLSRRLIENGVGDIRLFVGGRTKSDLLELPRFEKLGVAVYATTNDGSYGENGLVTVPLDRHIQELRKSGGSFEMFACGPDGMLKAVATRAVEIKAPGWISMDRHMICGVGACYACIQKTVRGNSRCCIEGPVFRAEDLVW